MAKILSIAVMTLLSSVTSAAPIVFDFSWSSSGGAFVGTGIKTAATGSATGTFTVDVGAGDSFTESDLTALDIEVTTTNYGMVQYVLADVDFFQGMVDGTGSFATFTDLFLDEGVGLDDKFGCGSPSCANDQVFHGLGGIDTWDYGSQAAAQASFVATARVTSVPEPGTLGIVLVGLAVAGLSRKRK